MHKRLLLLSLFTLVLVFSYGQRPRSTYKTDSLPPQVVEGLLHQYPKAKVQDWKLEKGNYEIKIKTKRKKTVFLNPSGKWLRTYENIDFNQLPQAVVAHFSNGEFGQYEVLDLEKWTFLNQDELYMFDLKLNHRKRTTVFFTSNESIFNRKPID